MKQSWEQIGPFRRKLNFAVSPSADGCVTREKANKTGAPRRCCNQFVWYFSESRFENLQDSSDNGHHV